jgi:hypothetical protein
MPYFPQLVSGAGAQFPALRRIYTRTVRNSAPDGTGSKLADPGWSGVEWALELKALTTEEWDAIEKLFHHVEGRLGTFTFLDPTDNLIRWSEDLDSTAWWKDSLLHLTPGIPDPLGLTRATKITNSSLSTLAIRQTLPIPGWFRYCFSLFVRGGAADASVFLRTAGVTHKQQFRAGPTWFRVEHAVNARDQNEGVDFGLEVGAGQSLEVFGFQVESQAGASGYKRTTSRSGIYPAASFLDDVLTVRTDDPGLYSCGVRIGWRAGATG